CRGAAAGVPGLAAFALVVILVPDSPWISLPLATAAWLVTAVVSYLLWRRVREAFGLDERPSPTGTITRPTDHLERSAPGSPD
ncbi:MAG: hypothetical protein ACXWCM_01455, partial [Acidimicrobiales bacterium]